MVGLLYLISSILSEEVTIICIILAVFYSASLHLVQFIQMIIDTAKS
jgi:hypothetical protein